MRSVIDFIKKHGMKFEWVILLVVYLYNLLFAHRYIDRFLDGDNSAELVAGNILSKEGGILVKDWINSTWIHVIGIRQVSSIFFHITNNWHEVRICTMALMTVVLLMSIIFLARQMGIKNYPLAALLFLFLLSTDYYEFVLYGMYNILYLY